MTSTDGDTEIVICKSDLNMIEAAFWLTKGYTKELANVSVEKALHIITDVRSNQSTNTGAQARIDAVVKELEETLEHSKEKRCGFTAEEAGWVGGYESGLSVAIALLKEGRGK